MQRKKHQTKLRHTVVYLTSLLSLTKTHSSPLLPLSFIISTSPLRMENVIPFVSVALNVFLKPLSP